MSRYGLGALPLLGGEITPLCKLTTRLGSSLCLLVATRALKSVKNGRAERSRLCSGQPAALFLLPFF
eukprot:6189089-Pleurochrysis_carterae.AAC.4